jgi:hypothetical protein
VLRMTENANRKFSIILSVTELPLVCYVYVLMMATINTC